MGTRVTLILVGSIVTVIISRALGPEGRGTYATVIAIAMMAVAIAHLSIEQVQVYEVGIGRSGRSLTANALVLGCGVGALSAGLTLLISKVTHYPSPDTWHSLAFALAIAGVAPNIMALYANSLLVLEGRLSLLNCAALLAGGVQLLLLGLLGVMRRLNAETVISIWLLSSWLPLVIAIPSLRPRFADLSFRLMWQEIRIGVRYHAGMVSRYLLLRVDVLLLAGLSNARAVGLYTLGVSIVELLNVATDSVATVIVRQQTSLSMPDSARFTARAIGVSSAIAGGGSALLGVASWALIPPVFGQSFRGTVPAVIALIPGVMAFAATRPASAYLVRLNRPWIVTALNAAAMVANVALNVILIPRMGVVGASLASSVAYAFLALSFLYWFVVSSGATLDDFKPSQVTFVRLRRHR